MSESSKFDKLNSYLDNRNYNFISEIKDAHSDEIDFFLFVSSDVIGEKAVDSDITSFHQMMSIRLQVNKSLGIKIKWVVEEGEDSRFFIEALKKAIRKKYSDAIKQISVSPIRYSPVWIFIQKNDVSKVKINKKDIIKDIKPALEILGIEEVRISFQNVKDNFPSNPVILLCIKIYAPISLTKISEKLMEKGYREATKEKLKPKIETLRKYGLIVWSENDIYSLTLNAQESFTYVNPKKSPDVLRALELGSRKWDN